MEKEKRVGQGWREREIGGLELKGDTKNGKG